MTAENPEGREKYLPHQPSEQDGLVPDLDTRQDPQYLLEETNGETSTFQLDFGYFQHQTDIGDW